MKVIIEKYRGVNIEFDTENELFVTEIKDNCKESKSFSATKKFIDEYLKDNSKFEPFYIISSPDSYSRNKRLKVVGIRKDGLFVYEEKGEKKTLSGYDEKYYLIEEPQHNEQLAGLAVYELAVDNAQKKLNEERKKVTGINLKSVKSNYLQS